MRITVKVSAVPRVDMVRFPLPSEDLHKLTKPGSDEVDPVKVMAALQVPGVQIGAKDNGGVVVFGAEILSQAQSLYGQRSTQRDDYGPKGSCVESRMDKGEHLFVTIDVSFLNSKGRYRARVRVGNPYGIRQAYARKAADICAETFASIIIHIARSVKHIENPVVFEDDEGYFARAREFMDRARDAEAEEKGGAL